MRHIQRDNFRLNCKSVQSVLMGINDVVVADMMLSIGPVHYIERADNADHLVTLTFIDDASQNVWNRLMLLKMETDNNEQGFTILISSIVIELLYCKVVEITDSGFDHTTRNPSVLTLNLRYRKAIRTQVV